MKRLMTKWGVCITFLLVSIVGICTWEGSQANVQAKPKTYTITTKSKPKNKKYLKYRNYTKYTKNYFAIRDRLERLEKSKGGTIIIKKGTYNIPNVLYIPSNVTIIFKDGVVLNKGNKTGAKKFKPAATMFEFVRPSRSKKKRVYGKYNGEKNITLKGEGNVVINMKRYNKGISMTMGHNQNVTITGITFKNMKTGHYIEMDASKNVNVNHCKFLNATGDTKKEAINLDTPDKTTRGFTHDWSKYDKTANYNVTIENCYFSNVGRSIGTHQYSGGKYHTNVVIRNCKMYKNQEDPIRLMNWKNPVITDNIMDTVKKSSANGVRGSGVLYPTIKRNTFKNIKAKAMLFSPWKNSGGGSQYKVTYDKFSETNIKDLADNVGINVRENIAKIAWKYNNFESKNSTIINLKTK